jgi:hypothetical protein
VKSTTPSNVKHLLQVALDHELRVLKIGMEKTRHNLHQFEQQFDMESEHFYQEFQTGTMGDALDYIKWAGEYETLVQLQQDYAELQEIQLC